ncbi:restriction endonuclease [Maribacter sp. MMG018]|uniref:McrC family protein n=1 Tax=Maribacter sp. MMG018 TaxID=2822688 RepID=UPI001B381537|nr:restriction endonuclease [Maribacter sp. MMG018]MBQ4915282.1 restriction endonuclease [Maribacter sp. MMG018]
MSKRKNILQVFEHGKLYYGREYNGVSFEEKHFNALAKLNQLHNNEYFTLLHKGIKFSQYVGVIQIDGLTIEVLPKIDGGSSNEALWQKVLIDMLRATRRLKVNKVGQAIVNKQQIHLLDIYFEWFLNEVQLLVRQGLIKQYRKKTGNVKALKGKLVFAKHIGQNLIHKERFYTSHQIYDHNHQIHQILSLALDIIGQFSSGTYLYSKYKRVEADFPDVSRIVVNASTFKKLTVNRKAEPYRTALEIARLIILNFAPNISSGKENMLALLFDMNDLWEEYVLIKLKTLQTEGLEVKGQESRPFWNGIKIRPDIIVHKEGETYVIDTKWKNIGASKPSTHDLRQMYVYNEYWTSFKALLLYPSIETIEPEFIAFEGDEKHKCAIGKLNILNNDKLNDHIGEEIIAWFS